MKKEAIQMMIDYLNKNGKSEVANKHFMKVMVFSAFALILLFVLFTSFSDRFPITGSVLSEGPVFGSGSKIAVGDLDLEAELTVPAIESDGNFHRLDFSTGSDLEIYIGGERHDMGNLKNNFISLSNFDGEISFDKNKLKILNGRATKVIINGVIIPLEKETVKIRIDKPVVYSSLEVTDGIFIDNLDYITTGSIEIENGKKIFNINYEGVKITNFYGDFLSESGKMNLDGSAKEISITGSSNIVIR